jgi:hypothetical protein
VKLKGALLIPFFPNRVRLLRRCYTFPFFPNRVRLLRRCSTLPGMLARRGHITASCCLQCVRLTHLLLWWGPRHSAVAPFNWKPPPHKRENHVRICLVFLGQNARKNPPISRKSPAPRARRLERTLFLVLVSGGEKYPILPLTREISYRCFQRVSA